MNQRQAFTLIELLVVVAIIATMASMLLPAVAMARQRAGALACASSLRQLGMGALAFADDHEGLVPRAMNGEITPQKPVWYETMADYIGDNRRSKAAMKSSQSSTVAYGCPRFRRSGSLDKKIAAGHSTDYHQGYGMNIRLNRPLDWKSSYYAPGAATSSDFQWDAISFPSQRVLFGDSTDNWITATSGAPAVFANADPRRHMGQSNHVFFDVHVAAVTPYNLWKACEQPGM